MEHKWIIAELEYNNDEYGGVIKVNWRCETSDGIFSTTRHGIETLTPNTTDTNFIPLKDLTEENVLSWIWELVGKEEMEKSIEEQISHMHSPSTSKGLPWGTGLEAIPTVEVDEKIEVSE